MTSRTGVIARASRMAREDEARVVRDIVLGRQGSGLSQEDIGRPCDLSRSQVGRIERGARRADLGELACLGATVGLDIRMRAFPAGDAIRDRAQLALLARLRARLHPALSWATEVPLPIEGDLRAWDALITGPGWRRPVEAETVLVDIQALERRLALKRRDGLQDAVILLVADTEGNRRALRAASDAFADYPLRTRTILAALGAGPDPGQGGIAIL